MKKLFLAATMAATLFTALLVSMTAANTVQAAPAVLESPQAPFGQVFTTYLPICFNGYDPCAGVPVPRIESPSNGAMLRAWPNEVITISSWVLSTGATSVEGTIDGGKSWHGYSPWGDWWKVQFPDLPGQPDDTVKHYQLVVRNQCRWAASRFTVFWHEPQCGECRTDGDGHDGVFDEYGSCIPCGGCDEPPCDCQFPPCD